MFEKKIVYTHMKKLKNHEKIESKMPKTLQNFQSIVTSYLKLICLKKQSIGESEGR